MSCGDMQRVRFASHPQTRWWQQGRLLSNACLAIGAAAQITLFRCITTMRTVMKLTLLALMACGLILVFAAPVIATGWKGNAPLVNQQETCKNAEIWDEAMKKCAKKEG